MSNQPDTAGSVRARLRLIAVVALAAITLYWGVFAVYLLFLPETAPLATVGVFTGAICLVVAGLYGLIAWGTATTRRGLHITAIAVTVLGVASLVLGRTWDVWVVSGVNLVALVLLALTIPHRVSK